MFLTKFLSFFYIVLVSYIVDFLDFLADDSIKEFL